MKFDSPLESKKMYGIHERLSNNEDPPEIMAH